MNTAIADWPNNPTFHSLLSLMNSVWWLFKVLQCLIISVWQLSESSHIISWSFESSPAEIFIWRCEPHAGNLHYMWQRFSLVSDEGLGKIWFFDQCLDFLFWSLIKLTPFFGNPLFFIWFLAIYCQGSRLSLGLGLMSLGSSISRVHDFSCQDLVV